MSADAGFAMISAALPSGWLVDTLIATTLLCLVVLAIRRRVAEQFGPHVAYALWLIPALRMVLPPLPQLLTWRSPAGALPDAVAVDAASMAGAVPTLIDAGRMAWLGWAPVALFGVWMIGAAATLGWQALVHRRLSRALAEAELVEVIGKVRVYRSDAVGGPLSFGLLEPVIMLPADDRLELSSAERALAIDHELTHHARGDLWANGAAVLFSALHWFNPLVRGAWRAFRFDQEAACDASVLARSDRNQRGTYARALAKTATRHPSAFASPMIGPDRLKERLAMLTRPDVSPLRRRIGALFACTFLVGAMIATATPVLADHPDAPEQRPADADPRLEARRAADAGDHVRHIRRADGTTIVLRSNRALDRSRIDELVAEAEAARAEAERARDRGERATNSREAQRRASDRDRARHIIIRERTRAPADGEGAQAAAAVGAVDARRIEREARRFAARAEAEAMRSTVHAIAAAHDAARLRIRHAAVTADCGGAATSDIIVETGNDAMEDAGERRSFRYLMCGGDGSLALQLSAMQQARRALAALVDNPDLPEKARVEALAELDAEIASVERQLAERNN